MIVLQEIKSHPSINSQTDRKSASECLRSNKTR